MLSSPAPMNRVLIFQTCPVLKVKYDKTNAPRKTDFEKNNDHEYSKGNLF